MERILKSRAHSPGEQTGLRVPPRQCGQGKGVLSREKCMTHDPVMRQAFSPFLLPFSPQGAGVGRQGKCWSGTCACVYVCMCTCVHVCMHGRARGATQELSLSCI